MQQFHKRAGVLQWILSRFNENDFKMRQKSNEKIKWTNCNAFINHLSYLRDGDTTFSD